MRSLSFALALILCTAPAATAHLVAGRRPIDVLLARSDAAGFAVVERGSTRTATSHGDLHITVFRIVDCVRGPCPRGTFQAAADDEHSATYRAGSRSFVLFTREAQLRAGAARVGWRHLATEWEARTLSGAEPEGLRRIARRFGEVLALPPQSRAAAYVDALLEQLESPAQWLQEDALLSLLRVPAASVAAPQTDRLLAAAAATYFENIRLGVFLVAESWNAPALRRFLTAAPLDTWEAAVRARALFFLASGTSAERALPCRYLEAQEPAVRAAAAAACTPPGGGWVTVAFRAAQDPSSEVRRKARERLRAHPETRAEVRALAVAGKPWWKRLFYRVTGGAPAVVSEIFTPVGASSP